MTACAQEDPLSNRETDHAAAVADDRVPVTVLTGFLGSGKTTLLNRILTEQHGKRIAVIENEYGEIGIDHELVVQSDEEIFEMNNGCICCTVRGDLIQILGRLMRRKHRFDHILIETTGMADPGPVAQTFFMDEEIKSKLRLDAILTVVDVKHVMQHLESAECHAQLAFADILLLNKSDLVTPEDLAALRTRLQEINRVARIYSTVQGRIDLDRVLDVRAFDLETRAAEMPEFLQEELPFEWSGHYVLEPGRHRLQLSPGPDPTIDVVFGGPGTDAPEVYEQWKRAGILLYSGDPVFPQNGRDLRPGQILYRLPIDEKNGAVAFLEVSEGGTYALLTQHLPEEFDLALLDTAGRLLEPVSEQRYAAPHEHDDTVGSVGIRLPGELDPGRFEAWVVQLLRTRGTDIFRMKGVLALIGKNNRFVFQGVHMLFDGQEGRPWSPEEERESQVVFIGRDLDRQYLSDGLSSCLA